MLNIQFQMILERIATTERKKYMYFLCPSLHQNRLEGVVVILFWELHILRTYNTLESQYFTLSQYELTTLGLQNFSILSILVYVNFGV